MPGWSSAGPYPAWDGGIENPRRFLSVPWVTMTRVPVLRDNGLGHGLDIMYWPSSLFFERKGLGILIVFAVP